MKVEKYTTSIVLEGLGHGTSACRDTGKAYLNEYTEY